MKAAGYETQYLLSEGERSVSGRLLKERVASYSIGVIL